MIENLRKWLQTILAVCIFAGAVVGLSECDRTTQQAGNGAKVESVLVILHDTIKTIDTLLKKKVIYRDTGRIEYIHDDLDKVVPPIGDENVMIAENQLRDCMKCKDSLDAFKAKSSVDSQTIDTLSKLAKKPDTIKACTFTEQAKSFGIGTLFGIAIRSFF